MYESPLHLHRNTVVPPVKEVSFKGPLTNKIEQEVQSRLCGSIFRFRRNLPSKVLHVQTRIKGPIMWMGQRACEFYKLVAHPRVRTPRRTPAGAGSLPAMISASLALARSVTSITAFLTRFARGGFFAAAEAAAGRSAAAGSRSTRLADAAGLAWEALERARQACSEGVGAGKAARGIL